jgi:hypothetical protein
MMRTPDGHGRVELSRFLTPPAVADHRNAPVNALSSDLPKNSAELHGGADISRLINII